MPGVGIQVAITGDATGLKGALGEAEGGLGKLGGAMNALPMVAVAGAAIGVAVAIGDMTMAAAEDRAEQEKLLTTYQNTGAAVGDYTASIDAAIAAGAEKAFSDSEVRDGLTSLVTATGNAEEANALLAQAMDIARAAGVPLEQAADAVAKAHGGQDAALRKLFPGMEKQATAADTITEATKLSTDAADDYAKSAEGMGKKGSDAFGELGEKIGSAFLPILDEVMPLMGPIVDIISELIDAVLPLLGPAIHIVVAALKIFLGVLQTLIGVIKEVMGFIGDLVRKAQDAVNFVGSIDLNPFSAAPEGGAAGAYPETAARSRRGGRAAEAPAGNMTVNVYGGDPWRIEQAVKRGFRGWTSASGALAPTREY